MYVHTRHWERATNVELVSSVVINYGITKLKLIKGYMQRGQQGTKHQPASENLVTYSSKLKQYNILKYNSSEQETSPHIYVRLP